MKYDYHMHTFYCKHADVSVAELVAEYLNRGFIEMGISDHIPYPGELDSKDNSRMYLKEMELYLNEIKEQQSKNGNKIKIYAGFESEYFPTMHNWYTELLKRDDVDYLILGIHAVENLDPENNFNKNCTNKYQLQRYWDAINQGMRTGMFLYAVHPDFYMKSYEVWDEDCQKLAEQICDLALELDFPLGFNINGFWKGPRVIGNVYRNKYPIHEFWKVAKAKGVKILLESDTHHKKQLYDKEIIDKTHQLLKDWEIDHLLVDKVDVELYKERLKTILK
ncbi:histidinol-phosphatase [Mycoplasma hafezii]|uniref:histidinol-phosphatase n=1 Tax=Mycoplasma hafezii TaxID=525886 RepID=UPI003CEDDA59